MDPRELSERKKQILKAVIEAHIETGEPVGSKYLMQYKRIAYSSATIRKSMVGCHFRADRGDLLR